MRIAAAAVLVLTLLLAACSGTDAPDTTAAGPPTTAVTTPPTTVSLAAEVEHYSAIVLDVVQIGAILLGGSWAYLKFIRGRTFKPRGDLRLSARLLSFDTDLCLVVRLAFENAGLSRIRLVPPSSRVFIDWLPSGRWAPGEALWMRNDEPVSTELLRDHEEVEPGETVVDEGLLVADLRMDEGIAMALLVRADVVGVTGRIMRRFVEWSAQTVVPSDVLIPVKDEPEREGPH